MSLSLAAMGGMQGSHYYVSHDQDGSREVHELVMRIKEPELCYVFARNAQRRGYPELTLQAYRRAVELRAEAYPTTSAVELAAVRAIYAYEEALTHLKGRRMRATGTWQLVRRFGLVEAISRRMVSGVEPEILEALSALDMEDYSFSAVRAAYPDAFRQMVA